MAKPKTKVAKRPQNKLPERMGQPDDVEELDPTPMEMPIGCKTPMALNDMIAMMIRNEVQREKDEPFETPEEADDFEPVDEELLDFSPYELHLMEDQVPQEGEESQEPPIEGPGDDSAQTPQPEDQAGQEDASEPPAEGSGQA